MVHSHIHIQGALETLCFFNPLQPFLVYISLQEFFKVQRHKEGTVSSIGWPFSEQLIAGPVLAREKLQFSENSSKKHYFS